MYPPSQDIYSQFKEEQDIDPEDPSRTKDPIEIDPDQEDIEELDDDIMGSDLDVPGSDLDDDLEEIGSEDEENNYYSIGGDNHHDLEDNDGIEDLEI
ncbi:MAG: RNA polymerase I-specific transcription initiation factor RRN3 family protein [Bacteroidota bacterium]|nr:RNA polymerase I-specific transcription initiation factor RRN3 family protein [Bacteroidota bacterium]